MTEVDDKKTNWGMRILIGCLVLVLLLVALVIGLRLWISTSGRGAVY